MRKLSTRSIGIAWLTLVLTLLMIAPTASALTPLDGWLDSLPAADVETARALADHLNNQWAVIYRDQMARDVLEYETGALAKAQAAIVEQESVRQTADALLIQAQAATADSQSALAKLAAMRDSQSVFESAQRAYNLAVKTEQSAKTALDNAQSALNAARIAADDAERASQSQADAYAAADQSIQTLRDALAASKSLPADDPKKPDEKTLRTLEADLAAAEGTHAAFERQVAQYAEQAAHTKDTLSELESKHNKVSAAETAALSNIAKTAAALDVANAAFDAFQTSYDELDAFEQDARVSDVKTKAALDAAQARADQAAEELSSLNAALTVVQSNYDAAIEEQQSAAAALAALRSRWQRYSACIGAVLDTYPMPAMDLLAAHEAAPQLYTVYLHGTRLYLFRPTADGAAVEPFLSTVLMENKTTVELTRNGKGIESIRYISVDGRTHLQSLGADASALFTGVYPTLIIDSQLRGMTQYLGEASEVKTTSMHGLTTLVQFGLDSPVRHESRPQ